MDEIKDVEKLEEVSIAATSICEGAKVLTEMLVDNARAEYDLLERMARELQVRSIKYKQLPHLDNRLRLHAMLSDLLHEIDLLRRGILPSDN